MTDLIRAGFSLLRVPSTAPAMCPGCCQPLPDRSDPDDYDDTSFITKLEDVGRVSTLGEFCSIACVIRFLRDGDHSQLGWFTAAEVDNSQFCEIEATYGCDCTSNVPSESQKHIVAYGFYGSPVDGGKMFCAVSCALSFFEEVVAKGG